MIEGGVSFKNSNSQVIFINTESPPAMKEKTEKKGIV